MSTRAAADIRRDLRFRVDEESLHGPGPGQAPPGLPLDGLLVQVGWREGTEAWAPAQRCYGVLIQVPQNAATPPRSYILEIPTQHTHPEDAAEEQEEIIRKYVNQMRQRWNAFFREVTRENQTLLVHEVDRVRRVIESCEGRWELVHAFRTNTTPSSLSREFFTDDPAEERKSAAFSSFFDWLYQRRGVPVDGEGLKQLLIHRMPFVVGQAYYVRLDWALPYICFRDGRWVNHYDSHGPWSEKEFHPFHNFQGSKIPGARVTPGAVGTVGAVEEEHVLKATYYSMFAYLTAVIDEIETTRQESYLALRHYYTYVANLSKLKALLLTQGPLQGKSIQEVQQEAEREKAGWSGDTASGTWSPSRHVAHLALGLLDIAQAEEVFTEVIRTEELEGRNAGRSRQVLTACYRLKRVLCDSPQTRTNYEDLWAHNRDPFGFELYFEKAHVLIAASRAAGVAYQSFVKRYVFEHPALDDGAVSASAPPDAKFWANAMYRTTTLLSNMWRMYYAVRAATLQSSAGATKWFEQGVPAGKAFHWTLHDPGARAFAQFLIKENSPPAVHHLEDDLIPQAKKILGARSRGVPSERHLEQIRQATLDVIHTRLRGTGIDLQQFQQWVPSLNEMRNWFEGVAPHGKVRWTLHDEGLRKFTNYLLGGGNLDWLRKVEGEVVEEIEKTLGRGLSGLPEPRQMAEIRERTWRVIRSHLQERGIDIASPRHAGTGLIWAINVWVCATYWDTARRSGWDTETTLRACTALLNLSSDVANWVVFRAYGLRASLRSGASAGAKALGGLEALGGGLGGVLGVVWYSHDAVTDWGRGERKDAVLESVAGVGCTIATVGLLLDGTAIGVPAGVVCNVVGFGMALIAESVKYFKFWESHAEHLARALTNRKVDDRPPGMDLFRAWFDECAANSVRLNTLTVGTQRLDRTHAVAITERVKEFLVDWDTFSQF